MEPVLTKADFVRRYKQGEFGNAAPTWDNLLEFLTSRANTNDLYHIRNRVAGAKTWYNVIGLDIRRVWKECIQEGFDPDLLYISAMAPTELMLIQGEVQRTTQGLYLTYSRIRKPMRDALAEEQRHLFRLEAKILLYGNLDNNSLDWLNHLLDTYDDHVVEFSTYSKHWGTVPRYNTVFWEVRKY